MLKNKIYKYLSIEIFKNFTIILLTFTAITWTVKAVNFLELMINEGFSGEIYFKYTLLNIFTIITRFVPLAFLLSLIISITKFERQQELLILWTVGLNKIKIANIFFLISCALVLLQIILGLFVNPYTLNKSRTLLRESQDKQINSILRASDFSDTFKSVTFYIDKKNDNNELINIFIKDNNGSLNTMLNEINNTNDTTIFAEKGFIENNSLILFNGTIQTLNTKYEIKNIDFKRTVLSLDKFATRTITEPKIQETSSILLLQCLTNNNSNKILKNCSNDNSKKNVTEALSRRVGMPLYIPLISTIASFLLIYKKERKNNFIKKYLIFGIGFAVLILAEILLRYTGFSFLTFAFYFLLPIFLFISLYLLLIKNMISEKIIR
jgi:lipopolysaccharide export system permease protein